MGVGGWNLNILFDEFKMKNKSILAVLNCSLVIYKFAIRVASAKIIQSL